MVYFYFNIISILCQFINVIYFHILIKPAGEGARCSLPAGFCVLIGRLPKTTHTYIIGLFFSRLPDKISERMMLDVITEHAGIYNLRIASVVISAKAIPTGCNSSTGILSGLSELWNRYCMPQTILTTGTPDSFQ